MAYTQQQATDAIAALDLDNLSSSQIENELKNIISQLSVEQKAEFNVGSNAKTVLYSNYDVSDFLNDPNVRLLDKTEAYDFLINIRNNDALIAALTKAYGVTPDFDDYNSPAGQFIGGIDGDPRTPGAWDTISRNFVKAGSGEVLFLVDENAKMERVFFQTEWATIQEFRNYNKINGVSANILSYLSKHGL